MRRIVALLTALAVAPACGGAPVVLTHQAPATFHEEPAGHEQAVVTRVIDGDTIEVRITGRVEGPGAGATEIGRTYSVRVIGIDTPETVHPRKPVQCFGREASAATDALVAGRSVRLVRDVEDADHFDRLLRYVYVGDEMVGARLVANGYAFAYTYPPNVRHSRLLVVLQRDARRNDRGLWASDACNGNP